MSFLKGKFTQKASYSEIKEPTNTVQFTVFEFIWIQYICKFCLVYHLIDLDTPRYSYNSFSETYAFL